jgi:hypothetical protein
MIVALAACDGAVQQVAGPDINAPTMPSLSEVAITSASSLSVDMDGTWIIHYPGTYTWEAHPYGGDGNYSYHWEIHYNDYPGWGWLGNGQSVTFGVSAGDGDFLLRVTVTSAGQSASQTRLVLDSTGCYPQFICN